MPDAGKNMDELFNLRAAFPAEEEKQGFFTAVRNNDIPALEKIIQKWPDAPAKWYDNSGKPVLIKYYDKASPETLEYLVSKGAKLEQTEANGNWTPLIHAAFLGTPKEVETLLRLGAEVDGKD